MLGFVLAALTSVATPDLDGTMPLSAATEAELFERAEGSKGFGIVNSTSTSSYSAPLLVLWWDPYSGVAATHVYAYAWAASRKRWERCIGERVEGIASAVEVVHGPRLVVRSNGGVSLDKALACVPEMAPN